MEGMMLPPLDKVGNLDIPTEKGRGHKACRDSKCSMMNTRFSSVVTTGSREPTHQWEHASECRLVCRMVAEGRRKKARVALQHAAARSPPPTCLFLFAEAGSCQADKEKKKCGWDRVDPGRCQFYLRRACSVVCKRISTGGSRPPALTGSLVAALVRKS